MLEHSAQDLVAMSTLRRRYPKTNIPAASPDHPTNFTRFLQTFAWASTFLRRCSEQFGDEFVCHKLRKWKWQMSTCFSGIGCAEMVPALCQLQNKILYKKFELLVSSETFHIQLLRQQSVCKVQLSSLCSGAVRP